MGPRPCAGGALGRRRRPPSSVRAAGRAAAAGGSASLVSKREARLPEPEVLRLSRSGRPPALLWACGSGRGRASLGTPRAGGQKGVRGPRPARLASGRAGPGPGSLRDARPSPARLLALPYPLFPSLLSFKLCCGFIRIFNDKHGGGGITLQGGQRPADGCGLLASTSEHQKSLFLNFAYLFLVNFDLINQNGGILLHLCFRDLKSEVDP